MEKYFIFFYSQIDRNVSLEEKSYNNISLKLVFSKKPQKYSSNFLWLIIRIYKKQNIPIQLNITLFLDSTDKMLKQFILI